MKARRLLAAILLAMLVVFSTSGPPPVRRQSLTAKQKLIRLIQILWEPDELAPITAVPLLGISGDTLAVEALLRAANDPHDEVRYRAIQGLGYVHDPRATLILLAAIRDPKTYAAWPLRRLNDPAAVDPLLTMLHDPSPDIRASIIGALGSSNDPRALEAIVSALKDPSADVRASAVRSIGARTDPRALQALASALGWAPEAARALIARPEHEAVDALLSGLRNPDERISTAASEAFWQPGNINQINVPIFVTGLRAALENESTAVAGRAALALGQLGGRRAVDSLLKALRNPKWGVRLSAMRALAKIKDDQAFSAVLSIARDRSSDLHWEAIYTLAGLKDSRALDALLDALNDNSHPLGIAVPGGLAALGHPRAIAGLAAAALGSDFSRYPHGEVVTALGRIAHPDAVIALAEILEKYTGHDQRMVAAADAALTQMSGVLREELRHHPEAITSWTQALVIMRSRQAARILIGRLKEVDKLSWLRPAATLGRFNEDRAVDAIIATLGEPDYPEIRKTESISAIPALIARLGDLDGAAAAAEALGRIEDQRALEPLRSILRRCPASDQKQLDFELRLTQANAALALGHLGDCRALPELMRALTSLSPTVARSVAIALASWKDRRAVDALLVALQHENSAVRDGAALALGEIGDARATPALASCLTDYEIAATVSLALSKLHWVPKTDRDQVYFRLALKQWNELDAHGSMSLRVLQNDLVNNNPSISEGAAYALIAMGAEAAVPGLVRALRTNRTDRMAKVYWNCGYPPLQMAATQWSLDNGVELLDLEIWDFPVVHWGGRDLDPVRFNPEYMYPY